MSDLAHGATSEEEGRRFMPTALFICGGLLIWAANFMAVYVVAAIACAKGFAGSNVAGMPFVAFAGTVLTLAAGAGTVAILRTGMKRLKTNGQLNASVRFIYFLAAAVGMLALVAILFNALPAWLLANECAQAR